MRRKSMLIATALSLSGVSAHADNGIYVGVGLAQSDAGIHNGTLNFKDTQTGYKAFGGVRPFKMLAVEVDYADYGRVSSGTASASSTSTGAYVLAIAPVPLIDIYAKAGMAHWQTDLNAGTASSRLRGTDLAWGGGVGAHFASLGARLEYEKVQSGSTPSLSMVSLSLSYTFL